MWRRSTREAARESPAWKLLDYIAGRLGELSPKTVSYTAATSEGFECRALRWS
jgi:hypothetical protein